MQGATADRRLVRAINRTHVLRAVREAGEISRASIARATGLSPVTVGSIVSDLLACDLLLEGDEAPSSGGRPSRLLLVQDAAYVAVGLKLTEDHLVAALTDLGANVVVDRWEALASTAPSEVASQVAAAVQGLLDEAEVTSERLLGIGIGMAGVVDESGVCRYSPFFGWRDVAVGALVEERVGVPVLVDNDVNTLALAERWFGVGRDEPDFLLVTIGRGVGLASVSGGVLHRGAGGAGEFGHTVVDDSRRRCGCGRVGCIEATVGEDGLVAAAREAAPDLRDHLADAAGVARVAETDERVATVVSAAGVSLGRGLANLVNLFAPRLIIVSGEGLESSQTLLDTAVTAAEGHVFPGLAGSFDIVTEPLPESAWARGAASLVLGELFETPTRSRLDLLERISAGAPS